MDPESQRDPAWAQLEAFRQDAAGIGQVWMGFLRERFARWAVRWTIGLVGILVITAFFPDLAWMWWAGAVLALLSLSLMLAGQWLISRKLARAQSSLDNLEGTLEELEADGLLDDKRQT